MKESNQNSILISASDLSVHRGNKTVLDKVELTIAEKEIVTIIGPNGAGKSTLIKTLLGLQKNYSGVIHKKHQLSVGYVPQKFKVSPHIPITVFDFLKLSSKFTRSSASITAEETSIVHLLKRPLQGLSGGELQRVLLARALLNQPQLLVLDELTQGVDINGQTALFSLIKQLREKRNCSVLMVSHDLHLVMASTDHVICLNHHVCCSGHPERIKTDPAFLQLFSQQEATEMAFYTHHHDHQHDFSGKVHNPKEQ